MLAGKAEESIFKLTARNSQYQFQFKIVFAMGFLPMVTEISSGKI